MDHWSFVLGAYAIAAGILLGYWWRVERRIRAIERRGEERRSP
jgi:hypothetical protein